MNLGLLMGAAFGVACGISVAGCSTNHPSDSKGTGGTGATGSGTAAPAGNASSPLSATPTSQPGAHLPPGIRRSRDGRYSRDVCDHSQRNYCFSHLLLRDGWQPGDPLDASAFRPESRVLQGSHPLETNLSGFEGMGYADIDTTYNIPSTATANGAIVAIIDEPDSNAASDLAIYRTNFGLGALTTCASGHGGVGATPCFSQVNQSGGASLGGDGGSADGETSLDMDMISAACPDCSILLVELTNGVASDANLQAATATAASLGAVAISLSWGGPETSGAHPSDYPSGFTTAGHLALASSGDWGYDDVDYGSGPASPSWPSSATDVVSVGGTIMVLASGSVGTGTYDEAVWNDGTFSTMSTGKDVGGSGCSIVFPMPSWQVAAADGACGSGGSAMRATADISAAAAYAAGATKYGILTYITLGGSGGWYWSEGTSASAPLVAAILTRIGLAAPIADRMSGLPGISLFDNSTIAAFNDLGSSSYPIDSHWSNTNAKDAGTCSPSSLCNAQSGWDGPSGLGTPNTASLAALRGNSTTGPRGGHGRPL